MQSRQFATRFGHMSPDEDPPEHIDFLLRRLGGQAVDGQVSPDRVAEAADRLKVVEAYCEFLNNILKREGVVPDNANPLSIVDSVFGPWILLPDDQDAISIVQTNWSKFTRHRPKIPHGKADIGPPSVIDRRCWQAFSDRIELIQQEVASNKDRRPPTAHGALRSNVIWGKHRNIVFNDDLNYFVDSLPLFPNGNLILAPDKLTLPKRAPDTYGALSGCDPITFLKAVWGPYIEAGLLRQSDLRRLDKRLYDAFHSYCQQKKISPSSILPTTRLSHAQLPAEERLERMLKKGREAAARYRARKKGPTPT